MPDSHKADSPYAYVARRFHENYEALAPVYGYETRKESAVPWEEVPEVNRRLMVMTVNRLVGEGTITVPRERAVPDDGMRWVTDVPGDQLSLMHVGLRVYDQHSLPEEHELVNGLADAMWNEIVRRIVRRSNA